jgi:hypothetical protein
VKVFTGPDEDVAEHGAHMHWSTHGVIRRLHERKVLSKTALKLATLLGSPSAHRTSILDWLVDANVIGYFRAKKFEWIWQLMWTRSWPESASDTRWISARNLRSYLLVGAYYLEEKQNENLSVATIKQVSNALEFRESADN